MKYYAIINEDNEIQPCQEIMWDFEGKAIRWQYLVFAFREEAEAWIEAFAANDEEVKDLLHIVEFDPLDSFVRSQNEEERAELESVERAYGIVLMLVAATVWVLGFGAAWIILVL